MIGESLSERERESVGPTLPFPEKRWIVPIFWENIVAAVRSDLVLSDRKWKIFRFVRFYFNLDACSPILLITVQIFFNSFAPSSYQKSDKQFVEVGRLEVSTGTFAVESRSDSSELLRVKGLLRKRLDKFANG